MNAHGILQDLVSRFLRDFHYMSRSCLRIAVFDFRLGAQGDEPTFSGTGCEVAITDGMIGTTSRWSIVIVGTRVKAHE